MVLLGSNLSSTYLYANYLLTLHENRKADEKLVLAIRRNTLSLARSALVKTVQAVQASMPNVRGAERAAFCVCCVADLLHRSSWQAPTT